VPAAVWTELAIEVGPAAAEVVASAVAELTGGVELRDGGTLLPAGVGRILIVAQCAPEAAESVLAAVDETCARARAAGLAVDPVTVRSRHAHEDEWRDIWKQYFRATRVGRRFFIRPTWDAGAPGPGDRIIDIDPGRAFGTGGHASTRLCMVLAEEIEERPVGRFLDLGCGSGILSIAAARLWPNARGVALDNDPEATACAFENLARNQVVSVEARVGTLADLSPAGQAPFDLVLANIQADVLGPLAPALAGRLAPAGTAILSGLLREQAPAIVAAYRGVGLTAEAQRDEDEWTALRLVRP
jgi:ribosomal protein L11 methyltransferase